MCEKKTGPTVVAWSHETNKCPTSKSVFISKFCASRVLIVDRADVPRWEMGFTAQQNRETLVSSGFFLGNQNSGYLVFVVVSFFLFFWGGRRWMMIDACLLHISSAVFVNNCKTWKLMGSFDAAYFCRETGDFKRHRMQNPRTPANESHQDFAKLSKPPVVTVKKTSNLSFWATAWFIRILIMCWLESL